jgi:histidine ammonia-lyase
MDLLADSVTTLAVSSERRTARLLDPSHNGGLPAFLVHPEAAARTGSVPSGLMIAQYTAAALVAEMRMRSVPASVQSIPTGANTEDYVSMCPLAARRALWAAAQARTVLAIELLCACQALDVRWLPPPPRLQAAYDAVRARLPVMIEDRPPGADIESVVSVMEELEEA